MSATKQAPPHFSLLGLVGTFTYAVLKQVAPPDSTEVPAFDAPMALRLVYPGETDYTIVPIGDSVEGGVNATLDALTDGFALQIKAGIFISITFSLAVRPGAHHEGIRTISTHSRAWVQCRGRITERLGSVIHVSATSIATGVKTLAESDSLGFKAILYPPATVKLMGLELFSGSVADNPGTVTRLIMVDLPGSQSRGTGADKTTPLIQLPHDEAGTLLSMLEQFSACDISLPRTESRLIDDPLGCYTLSIDAGSHLCDERIQVVLIGLHRMCPQVIFLGSYPSASGERIRLRPGTSDADFQTGREFVKRLLAGRM